MLVNSPSDFEYLEIGLASPDRIRYWSYGEIEKPETINYRTFKPERKGLFCEKVFGPVKDWECSCGKYRRVRYRGIVCERCGVEVTHSKVRRERMGHIELAAPVTHIWFLKGIPSYLGLLLDLSTRQLEEVIYYDSYIVTEVSSDLENEISARQIIATASYYELKEKYGPKFKADIGANAIKTILKTLDLKQMVKGLREELITVKGQKRLKATKRLRIVESLYKSGNQPDWMVLDVVPVMPPDLRPMVQLEGGRFATSDLNDLYRRVVNRNNRLKRLMDIGAPDMIVRNEKRMLQEAVDVMISNGKRGRSVTGSNGRPLKSLGNIIEGKQGRFRQNLLGKRVDYSARSVIVVGPTLKFSECGLPKEMALELFKPFVIRKLVEDAIVSNVKSAKRKIEKRDVAVWDILEKVIKGQMVLLNRAPTLHRLGIQAFEPILVEGSAIQVHPLVCTAFNADFDGDQMAVHVPLSVEAQAECKMLILSTNNILSPSSGRSIVTPTQDMILGCYYLTVENSEEEIGKGKYFKDFDEALKGLENKIIRYQSEIVVRDKAERYTTTAGRIIFNNGIREVFDKYKIKKETFINHEIGKSQLSELVYDWYTAYGSDVAADLCDNLKKIGFKYSALSGISISIDDLKVPEDKPQILEQARIEVERFTTLEKKGQISSAECTNRSNDIWRNATQEISGKLEESMGRLNNVFIMANSGARGNMDQVRQLSGMRGLMSDSQGRTVSIPIRSNFKEGLSLTEYFISAYGARKGLVDTALRTADSGYLTRRLVDVAQDVMITIVDCGTKKSVVSKAICSGVKTLVSLSGVIEGRVVFEDVKNPETNKNIIKKGELITRKISEEIEKAGVVAVKTRSVYNCEAEKGFCQKCYGLDLATAKEVNLGEAVGIIAAQSIGEPGTQLTMRTFHTGGVDLRKASLVVIDAPDSGEVTLDENLQLSQIIIEGKKQWISVNEGNLWIKTKSSRKAVNLPKGAVVEVKPNSKVEKGEKLAEFDPFWQFSSAEMEGVVKILGEYESIKGKEEIYQATTDGEIFIYNPKETTEVYVNKDVAEKCTEGQRVHSEIIGQAELPSGGLIVKIESDKAPSGDKRKANSNVCLTIAEGHAITFYSGAIIYVKNKDKVVKGDVLTREVLLGADASKTEDIVQGLPRVEELFEARKPKEAAVLAEMDGVIDIVNHNLYISVIITSESGSRKEYKITKDSHLLVYSGKKVSRGDQLNTGTINPHDISETIGIDETQKYLGEEVQRVYTSQGVQINSKHIEVIVRQMTKKMAITDMGDSTFLLNELIDIRKFKKKNEELKNKGKLEAKGTRILLGITRSSLNTESFISASSFQQTASVLTKAAIEGQIDPMSGLKENVIIGKLIPAGTGMPEYLRVSVKIDQSEEELELMEKDVKELVKS